ncbi:TonB-dependent receptor [Niabella sp.]|uniref:TonB-dependent receptor n=1 Tax=Niabella sp. TaxID=1962976 RepID=UPI00261EBF2D|nr:TonB-dependent receptor [Niabella sp.]
MNRIRVNYAGWLLACCLLTGMGYAQTVVRGVVTGNQEPVSLANVLLEELRRGAVTDSAGYFIICDVPPGAYTLQVSCVGYIDVKLPVRVKKNEQLTIPVALPAGDGIMDEIVITGVSKATRIRENPLAVTSISSKQIEQTASVNIIDALVKNVPGLHAVQTGPNISKPFIRGLGYNRVLTLYDGLRQEGQQWGDEHGIEVDGYNIDRAEVIKGPSSLQYGSDALAGVVSLFPFVPGVPDKRVHGKFTGEYQTNNNLIGNGLRFGYDNGHFLLAAGGSYRMAKDYRNPVDGRVYLTRFRESNLSALAGYKTDKGFIRISLTLYDNLQAIPDGSRDSLTRKFTKQVYEGTEDTIGRRPVVPASELNGYRLPGLSQHIQHYRAYLNSRWQAGTGGIELLLGAQQNIRREYNHPALLQQPGMYVKLNTLNYGLRYHAPVFSNIEATIGLNGMFQHNKSLTATDFPIPDYHLGDGGIYTYAKWSNDRWTVSGGLRYDLRQVQWDNFYVKPNDATGFDQQAMIPDTTGAVLQFEAYRKIFAGMAASVGGTFRVSDQLSLKANIGRGYRAPNITEMASNGLDPGAHMIYLGNRNFKPEFSLQEDIGVSARFKNFSADVSFFNTDIEHYIYLNLVTDANGNALADPQGNKTYQYRQARAQLYGAEVWLAVHPRRLAGFRFDNSLALVYGFNREAAYKNKGIQGAYLPLIPPLKWVGSLSQVINPRSGWLDALTPKLSMECTAAQGRYLGLDQTETATAGFMLFHAGVVAAIPFSKMQSIQVQFEVTNLFNKAYQSNLNRLKYFEHYAQSPNGHSGIYNMGRNGSLKIILPF